VNWNSYKCPFCGGDAFMGIMSLIARCEDCGAENTDMEGGRPARWVMPCADAAD
jgi:ribosomal protein L37AE/L43A